MFNRDTFNIMLAGHDFGTALVCFRAILNDTTTNDNEKKSPLREAILHDAAKSEALNEALTKDNSDAKEILKLMLAGDNLLTIEKSTGKTLFHTAVSHDNRAIASNMMEHMKREWSKSNIGELLMKTDKDKRLPFHYAVMHCQHKLIEAMTEYDDAETREMFFSRDKDGLFSGAIALKQYRDNPTELTMSIVNQLYFSLPKGRLRTKIAEEEVYMGWGIASKTAVWRYALRYCAKRDANNKITGMDLNLVDFINQALNDGIRVMGFDVSHELMYEYSNSYSGTPDKMLREAFKTLSDGLPGRTLGQATENTTLSRNKEFMRRAKLEEGDFWLTTLSANPNLQSSLSYLQNNRDYMVLFDNKLYYLPAVKDKKSSQRDCHEINYDSLSEREKKRYIALRDHISKTHDTVEAKGDALKNLVGLIPLIPPASSVEKKDVTFSYASGFASTFFADVTAAEITELEKKILEKEASVLKTK